MIRTCRMPSVIIIAITAMVLFLPVGAYSLDPANLNVEDGTICRNVVDYNIINPGTSFPVSVDRLFCFTKVTGAPIPTEITHVWYHGDIERARVTLPVGSPHWRTYSSKAIQSHEVGAWQVDVLDESKNPIKSLSFTIVY